MMAIDMLRKYGEEIDDVICWWDCFITKWKGEQSLEVY